MPKPSADGAKSSAPSSDQGGQSQAAGGVAEAGGDAGAKRQLFTNQTKVSRESCGKFFNLWHIFRINSTAELTAL